MADVKKYYYMRLKEDFFDTDEIKILESMEDGYLYSNILLKMYLKSLKHEGRLMLNNIIPYNAKMIASVTGHQIGTVERALQIFSDMGFIEIVDNGAIYMMAIQNYIGESTNQADRQREYDRRIAAEKKSVRNLEENHKKSYLKIEKKKDIDIEQEKEEPGTSREGSSKTLETVLSEFDLDEKVKEAIREFIKMRKLIKAPMTNRALILLINKLREMDKTTEGQIAILNQSIENSWKGIYEIKKGFTQKPLKGGWSDINRQGSSDDIYSILSRNAGY